MVMTRARSERVCLFSNTLRCPCRAVLTVWPFPAFHVMKYRCPSLPVPSSLSEGSACTLRSLGCSRGRLSPLCKASTDAHRIRRGFCLHVDVYA
jgi:hypothetical protein